MSPASMEDSGRASLVAAVKRLAVVVELETCLLALD